MPKISMGLFEYIAIIIFLIISLMATVQAAESCVSADCSTLGYTQTVAECSGKMMIKCPFDITKAHCNTAVSNCGDNFYGKLTCPDNATCVSCIEGSKTFQKTITCTKDFIFDNTTWTCKDDRCPTGYARNASNCGTSGSNGWTLGTTSRPSGAGNACYQCVAKTCSTTEYPYTTCGGQYCYSCKSGDGAERYKCASGTEYYKGYCLCILVSDYFWTGDSCSNSCIYNSNLFSGMCRDLKGKSIYNYPVNGVTTMGKIIEKDSNNYYYDNVGYH